MIIINYPKGKYYLSGTPLKIPVLLYSWLIGSLAFTDAADNNFSPINIASDQIDLKEQSATASTLGLLTRKAHLERVYSGVFHNQRF